MLFAILGASAALSVCYCIILERLHDIYSPDHIWVTVLVGNGLILATCAVLAAYEFLSWEAVKLFLLVNVVWGVPVIAWQLWQAVHRHRQMEP